MTSTNAVKQKYPELSQITTLFVEQDWTEMFDIEDGESLLVIEIVGQIFRDHIKVWLSDDTRSVAAQKEIEDVLQVTTTAKECEQALGIENNLKEFYGINIRTLLNNLKTLLSTKGHVVY